MTDKIYLDMDGVLADFDGAAREFCGLAQLQPGYKMTKEEDDLMWAKLKEVPHFYDRLEPMDGALDMFNKINGKFPGKVEILTGIPKPKRGITTAGEDKINWAHRYLSPTLKVNIVYREQKKDFCTGPDSILIDDREDNIELWRSAGGTGIVHVSPEKTLEELFRLTDF